MPVADFCQLAVDKKGVLLLPATIYEMDEQYFRMGYGNILSFSLKYANLLVRQESFACRTIGVRFAKSRMAPEDASNPTKSDSFRGTIGDVSS